MNYDYQILQFVDFTDLLAAMIFVSVIAFLGNSLITILPKIIIPSVKKVMNKPIYETDLKPLTLDRSLLEKEVKK